MCNVAWNLNNDQSFPRKRCMHLRPLQVNLDGGRGFMRMSSGKVTPSDDNGEGDLPTLWGGGGVTSRGLGRTNSERSDTFPGQAFPGPAQSWDGRGRPPLGPPLSSSGRRRIAALSRAASFSGLASLRGASSLRRGTAPSGRPSMLDAALMPLQSIAVRSSSGEDEVAVQQRVQVSSKRFRHTNIEQV